MDSASISSALESMILTLAVAFNARSSDNFRALVHGVVLCLGRPWVTNMARAAGEQRSKDVTTLHRFFSRAKWSIDEVMKLLVTRILLPLLAPQGALMAAADDTTAGKTGRKVAFAGWYRDAVKSTSTATVKHWAHNWVVLCLIIPCPFFPSRFLHIPILARLYRKEDQCGATDPFRTRQELLLELVELLASWVGGRRIELLADGAYPSKGLLRALPKQVCLTSRIRRDASLFELPPPRTGRPGRPAEKGKALPKLERRAKRAKFAAARVLMYGKQRDVLLHTFVAIWASVSKQPIRVVIVRDPAKKQPDDFFFTTDVASSAADIAARYAARWGIEEVIREAKQSLGFDQVQSWSAGAVVRQAPFILLVHALVQAAHLQVALAQHAACAAESTPPPSFGRMLTALRFELWARRISGTFAPTKQREEFLSILKESLATAA